jgi:hypothetical protein
MNNLRVVYDNAADRATLSASSTAGGLVVNNLLTDFKSEVWRSTSTTATLTITWATAEIIGMVALAFCSLSPLATFRVRGYAHAADTTPLIDVTGYACEGSDLTSFNWGSEPLGVNAYSYGGGTYGVLWFTQDAYEKLVIDIVDNTNTLGYIEASRVICGSYWSPTYNAEYGVQVGITDNSKQERTDAGDLRTDRGTIAKTLSFDVSFLTSQDRNKVYNILRGNGLFRPIYVSLTPEADDPTEEQVFQIYGKMSRQGSIKYQFINQFSSTIEIEEL